MSRLSSHTADMLAHQRVSVMVLDEAETLLPEEIADARASPTQIPRYARDDSAKRFFC